jgi:hypothetical protein
MDFDDAFAETAPRKGPLSTIDKLLSHLESQGMDEQRTKILRSLTGDAQAAHLGRALTQFARHHRVIGETSHIDGQAVQTWRSKQPSK